ncbi:MAG: D-glycero-beta-D-manno-heptose 1,7-bisphosphate 7-phosphatase [Burkholderiaceae bacterium]|jgi:D-glycero-D-manno-heptose 1,7-bisphosphate phosphatase|nr:D-glycero-beta-D-manno-heptose 1,7-bisphosphate 7-phosphatase [Burkholderiaceae bacterium]
MKLIILDRDGVINQDADSFIKSPEEWVPIPESLEAIARLHKAGYRIVIATNQSGLGRGFFDIITLNAIHQKMHAAVRAAGGVIDSIFFCPHAASDNCDCRKPRQGMFNAIAKRYDVSLDGVPSVGDSLRDLQAGFLAGCRPILVMTGKGKQAHENGGLPPETVLFENLAAVADSLLASEAEDSPEKMEKP